MHLDCLASRKINQHTPKIRTPVQTRLWAGTVTAAIWLLAALASSAKADVTTAGPAEGALVIVGGGDLGPEIVERFVSLAGGPDAEVVLIPTAAPNVDGPAARAEFTTEFGFKRVTLLHTADRAVADQDAFVAPLKNARAVWISGGRHWRLVDSYLDTKTQQEIAAVLERGGVVGGTSAGATILGSFLVRGAREGNHIMVAKDYRRGFGYLKNAAIDQHLLPRHRADDLAPVITEHPELLGLGIDESTAVVVQGNRLEVVGRGVVAINDGRDHDDKPYYFLAPGERFDLRERRRATTPPAEPRAN